MTPGDPVTIAVEREGALLHVVLNRPEKRHALTRDMMLALQAAFRDAEGDPDVRVVILRAAGPDFCAGFDLSRLKSEELPEDRFAREEEELYSKAHYALHEFGHTTRESQQLLHEARERRTLKEYFAKRDEGNLAP